MYLSVRLPRLASFFLAFLFLVPLTLPAQAPSVGKQPRILLLLDGSSSMLQPWQAGQNRFAAAARLIDGLMDSVYAVNPNVEFALRVYGHEHGVNENNCFDTRREVVFSKNNREQMGLRLASLHPLGVSPIAYSLKQAAENDLEREDRYNYSIILITDGGESCGGDLCQVSKELYDRNIFFKPYILSLVDYAPLAAQYECLGQYLTVANAPLVKKAIQTIVDSYRPALLGLPITKPKPQPVATVITSIPSVLNIPIPPITLPQRDSTIITTLSLVRANRTFPVYYTTPPVRTLTISRPALPARVPEPDELAELHYVMRTKSAPLPLQPVVRIRTLTIPRFPLPAPEAEPIVAQQLGELTAINRPLTLRTVDIAPRVNLRLRAVPRFPLPKREEDPAPIVVAAPPAPTPKTVEAPTPPAPKPPVPKPQPKPVATTTTKVAEPAGVKTAEYTATSEPAAEAGLQVYFTDGGGKFYTSSPRLQLIDIKTGAVVKSFYRTVDPAGNPDLQTIPSGTYHVLVAGRSNLMARNVIIAANEKKKVTIKVTSGSLRFAYLGKPNRPVSEFTAVVVRRFADDRAQTTQKCTAEPQYEPGNYYVEVNTTPVFRRNFDIDFGATTQIDIPEPGWIQFTNAAPLESKVVLYQPLGDGFASFLRVDITGDPTTQKIRLQPGTYEARWVKAPNSPRPAPATLRFLVKSNETASVELQ